MGEKFLTAVWEKIFLKGEGGIGLKTEKVGKCFHSKTGENYPLRELVKIKMFLKEKM